MTFKNEIELLDKVKSRILECDLSSPVAAFDADGTLWGEDINDLFFEYQEAQSGANFSETFNLDCRTLRTEHLLASLSGMSVEELNQRTEDFMKQQSLTLFKFQKEIMKFLKQKGFKIYIVTASLQRVVEKAVLKYDLPVDQVLGMNNKIKDGILTKEIHTPYTFGEGKKESLLKHVSSDNIVLAAGNSISDCPLIETAKVCMLVTAAFEDHPVYLHEKEAYEYALQKKDWIIFESENWKM